MEYSDLIKEIDSGKFKPVYLLMGEEPYYNDIIIEHLIDKALQPHERDFNQMIVYGSDTNAAEIASMARRYPVFAPRQLIIVKEAQSLTKLEPLEIYLQAPAPETVLVLVYTGKSVDKRSGFYKKAKATAEIFESVPVPEWKVAQWIISYAGRKGITVLPDAAALMAEHTGNSLRKIALEIDKLLKVIPEGCIQITVKEIEENIGISREFSAFELCNALSFKNGDNAFKIAHHFGENPRKYPLLLTLGALFFYFSKLLKIHAVMRQENLAAASAVKKSGIYPSQEKQYLAAIRNYSYNKVMAAIAYIKECDFKSKSSAAGVANEGDLLIELVSRILH